MQGKLKHKKTQNKTLKHLKIIPLQEEVMFHLVNLLD